MVLLMVTVGFVLAVGRAGATGLATGDAGFAAAASAAMALLTTEANLLLGSGWTAFECASRSIRATRGDAGLRIRPEALT